MSSSSSYAPCAACKYLRRKCTQDCVFAPYFPPENPQKFINVHKIFGASNVGKILNELDPIDRNDAVSSLAYEAECRIKNPIYGCAGLVSVLQHQLRQVLEEIERSKKELATYIGPSDMQPILNNPGGALLNCESVPLREEEMLSVYFQQQQEQLYFQQQQQVYLQQQFNNGGDFGQIPAGGGAELPELGGFSENHYQKQEQDRNSTHQF